MSTEIALTGHGSLALPDGAFEMKIPEPALIELGPVFAEELKALAVLYGCTIYCLRNERAWLITREGPGPK